MEPVKTKNQNHPSTLTINGKLYDAASGRPLDSATHQPLPKTRQYGSFDVTPATAVHSGPARSNTLRRSGLARPTPPKALASRHVRTITPVKTHPEVLHFGRPAAAGIDIPHEVHPSDILSSLNPADEAAAPTGFATQVQNYTPSSKSVGSPSSSAHRKPASHAVTEKQVADAPTHAHKRSMLQQVNKSYGTAERGWKRIKNRLHPTPALIITLVIAFIVIGSVVAYLTVPALSLFVAAKSAGVDATYPGYVPAGYHYRGPVTYGQGKVTIRFAAAGSSAGYNIEQNNTFWDSGAVLDNYVLARSQNYLTYSQGGITVYTFGSQAAWVNAGVLHTIDGTAQLTSDQILRIAGSM